MYILGINAYHGDSSSCLLRDGEIVVAIEEERLKRIKHWAGFPVASIKGCMRYANVNYDDIDFISINRDPNSNIKEKILFTIKKRPDFKNVLNRIKNRMAWGDIAKDLEKVFNVDSKLIEKKIVRVEHHKAHLASAFYVSPFDKAACLSIDGFGDFKSTLWGYAENTSIVTNDSVSFPHSLGLLYSSITQLLGFWNYGDEYKVMGMAAWGKPIYIEKIRELIFLKDNGKFELNIQYFKHTAEGIVMEWSNGYPNIGQIFKDNITGVLGPFRNQDTKIEQYHKDLAASLQFVFEETFFHILNHINSLHPKVDKLVLAGGVAQSSVAVGKIVSKTSFNEVWIQPAAGDAGGALGAALETYVLKSKKKPNEMKTASLGLKYKENEIKEALKSFDLNGHKITFFKDSNLCDDKVAQLLTQAKVIGYFQGRFEWGPRALGNRSIIVDPRIQNMKKLLNDKIKKRESFRPFAPSILEHCVEDWFEEKAKVPFMTHVFKIKKEKRNIIPAVVHVDGTGRLQTVNIENNKRYFSLIEKFSKLTQIPMILNTSFNENEPIVNSPKEALACYLRTNMDCLVLENIIIER